MRSHRPTATYRLQFSGSFTLDDARAIVPYLARLGVSHLYASPLLQSRRGSTHGYDVADPMRIDPELGGEGAFDLLAGELKRHDLKLLLDIVPNHMAVGAENPWWTDVLEEGPHSEYAKYFDIAWDEPEDAPGRVILPVLAGPLEEVLEKGELRLECRPQWGLVLCCHEHRFPVAVKEYRRLLEEAIERAALGENGVRGKIAWLLGRLEQASAHGKPLGGGHGGKRPNKDEVRAELADFLFNGEGRRVLESLYAGHTPDREEGREALADLHRRQYYRLAFWRRAADEINYRRFFDINDLVAVRIEDPEVFAERHRHLFSLVTDGSVDGVRIDHIDGLRDPRGYLEALNQGLRHAAGTTVPCYVLVEKILAPDEPLPPDWVCDGTSGYEFAAALNRLYVHEEGRTNLRAFYNELVPNHMSFEELVHYAKELVLDELFSAELHRLARYARALLHVDHPGKQVPIAAYQRALRQLTACLDVYRTYLEPGREPSEQDRQRLGCAFACARKRESDLDEIALSTLHELLLDPPGNLAEDWREFALRWQQLSGPAMAKGFEDTALYRHSELLALNEVGCEADAPALTPGGFRGHLAARGAKWPGSLNTTSTHDTKRSEDVRARLLVLPEIAVRWQKLVSGWREAHAPLRDRHAGAPVPDANTEYFLYQTLAGAWPLNPEERDGKFVARIESYLVKAAREAKQHTSWIDADAEWEAACVRFVRTLLQSDRTASFREEMDSLNPWLSWFGALNSLGWILLRALAPGVPDLYQGMELWTQSLVDPDNRRPVDFEERARLLGELSADGAPSLAELFGSWKDGRVKLHFVRQGFALRKERPVLFENGIVPPVDISGPAADHVIALPRRNESEWALALVPRFLAGAAQPGEFPAPGFWKGTRVLLASDAPSKWQDALSGRETTSKNGVLDLAELFEIAPFALLSPAR